MKRSNPSGGCLISFIRRTTLKIEKDEVTHVARLARLEFTEAETEKFTAQLNNNSHIYGYVKPGGHHGVEPMTHAIAQKNAFVRIW